MKDLKNNPEYQEGIKLGKTIVKFIDNSFYKSLKHALEIKEQLLEDFTQEMGWGDDHKEILKVNGTISVIKKALFEEQGEVDTSSKISLGDVDTVAKSINKSVTMGQAKEIIELYPSAQENDPSATWELVVENLIHEL